jgi:hypothetical protein
MEARLNPLMRLGMGACATALLWPVPLLIHIGGLILFSVLFFLNFKASRSQAQGPVGMPEQADI